MSEDRSDWTPKGWGSRQVAPEDPEQRRIRLVQQLMLSWHCYNQTDSHDTSTRSSSLRVASSIKLAYVAYYTTFDELIDKLSVSRCVDCLCQFILKFTYKLRSLESPAPFCHNHKRWQISLNLNSTLCPFHFSLFLPIKLDEALTWLVGCGSGAYVLKGSIGSQQ